MGLIEKCIPHTKKNNNDRTILQIIQHSHDGDHVYLFSPLSLSLIHIAIMWSTLCPIWGVVFTAVVVGHGLLTLGVLVFLSILGFSLLLTHFLFWNRRVRPGKTLNCAGWVGGVRSLGVQGMRTCVSGDANTRKRSTRIHRFVSICNFKTVQERTDRWRPFETSV